MSLELFIIYVYCMVVDELQNYLSERGKTGLRSRGPQGALTDAEALTIGFVGEALGFPSERRIWQYFKAHFSHYFPTIPSRCNFTRQLANVDHFQRVLFHRLSARLAESPRDRFIVDGFPIPLCKPCRKSRCRRFRGEADSGYCATKKEFYFGLKGHLVIRENGSVQTYAITSPKADERDVLLNDCAAVLAHHQGIADKGYISQSIHHELNEVFDIHLSTPLRKNMTETRSPDFLHWLKKTRRKIETVIGLLNDRFQIAAIRAYNNFRFMRRIVQKLNAYNVALLWLRFNRISELNFEAII